MTAPPHNTLSLRDAVARVVLELDAPVSRAELIRRVLALHPSQSRRPGDAVMAEARQHPALVRLEDDSLVSVAWTLQGVQFRYAPTPAEVASGTLCLFPCFTPFLLAPQPALVDGASGRAIDCRFCGTCDLPTARAQTGTERHSPAISLGAWLSENGVTAGDSLLFTVSGPRRGEFRVRHERAGDTDGAAVAIQDATLEAALCRLVERDPSGQPFLEQIIPAALARLHDAARAYPGRHWQQVVARSPRLRLVDDYALARATFRRPIDRLLGYCASPAAQKNLEARIDAFNADVERTLKRAPGFASAPSGASPCGRDEALRRSTRQIAAYLARHPSDDDDCYRCLALPSIYLAKHEGVSLAEGEGDMLCRFLLSYYPRRVLFNRKTFTARMLSTLRRFYAESPKRRADPALLSRLHRLVDRKVALFSELDMDAPEAAHMFHKLFPDVDRDDAELLPLMSTQAAPAGGV